MPRYRETLTEQEYRRVIDHLSRSVAAERAALKKLKRGPENRQLRGLYSWQVCAIDTVIARLMNELEQLPRLRDPSEQSKDNREAEPASADQGA